MGLRVGPNYQQRINHLDQPLKKLKREKAHKLNILKIRVIQSKSKNFLNFKKNVTVEKLGNIKNPVEPKASVLALKNTETERERGISNGGVREIKRKPLLINLVFNYNSNSGVSVYFSIEFFLVSCDCYSLPSQQIHCGMLRPDSRL